MQSGAALAELGRRDAAGVARAGEDEADLPHDVTLIATIAVGFALAFVFGFAADS